MQNHLPWATPGQRLGVVSARGAAQRGWAHRAAWLCLSSAACGCGLEAPRALPSALEASHLNQDNRSWEWCSSNHPEDGVGGAAYRPLTPAPGARRPTCITSRGSCGYRHFTDEETDAAQPSQSDPRRKWQGWGQGPVRSQHPLSGGRGEDWLGPWASLGAACLCRTRGGPAP